MLKQFDEHEADPSRSGLRREIWNASPVLPFEPTSPAETRMLRDRLSFVWITELYREVINWNALEVTSAEISRLEGILLSFEAEEY